MIGSSDRIGIWLVLAVACWVTTAPVGQAAEPDTRVGDRLAAEYFEIETAKLSGDLVSPGITLADWERGKKEDRRQLAEMLGLDPMPPKTPLDPVVVSTSDFEASDGHEGFRLERLHFQPMPGLYVAANFYRPIKVDKPLPTILYVCGHSPQTDGDIRFGNKAGYHHHGVWFARNGYTCLIVDTIQLGEFAGVHHGTYRLGRWWWANRGYTPAGVEAWTSIRALDYLETRPEVDSERFGVTGRSGGGAYSWWVAALDDRIKVAVPVAGITTLNNHVVDGCVEGHCDCMFMVNTYRWDYPRVAALVAPRALLISNSDKDGIFPLDGVVELHRQVREVYRLYDAEKYLGLQITEGPHLDTQNLRVHAFNWFNRFLKDDNSPIRSVADKMLQPSELKVFDIAPEDEQVSTIDETFIAPADEHWMPESKSQLASQTKQWLRILREKTFGGWPNDGPHQETLPENGAENANLQRTSQLAYGETVLTRYEFDSGPPYRLPFFVIENGHNDDSIEGYRLEILDQSEWDKLASVLTAKTLDESGAKRLSDRLASAVDANKNTDSLILFAPRGVGPTEWTRDKVKRTHLRRRFLLLGQTDDAMRIWDVRELIVVLKHQAPFADKAIELAGRENAAAWAIYASLFAGGVDALELTDLPASHRDGITLLNVSRHVTAPHVVMMSTVINPTTKLIGSPATIATWQPIIENSLCDESRLTLIKKPSQE